MIFAFQANALGHYANPPLRVGCLVGYFTKTFPLAPIVKIYLCAKLKKMQKKPRHQRHWHYHFSYPTTLRRHFGTTGVVLLIIVLLLLFSFHLISPNRPLVNLGQIAVWDLVLASLATFSRLSLAYVLALVVSVPLALLTVSSPKLERFLLPFLDIVQSIPVLAFFPVVVLVFLKINYFEGAAVFVLFMAMLWNLVFSMIGGLKSIPADVLAAAIVFRAKGLKGLWHITLPAIFPYILTGSLLAWAQGWNVIIVAEVLHSYIPGGTAVSDLFGLGSLLVNASYQANNAVFLGSLVTMIIVIGLLNIFVWQQLLRRAEKYKFD